jgi:hypothetical protein
MIPARHPASSMTGILRTPSFSGISDYAVTREVAQPHDPRVAAHANDFNDDVPDGGGPHRNLLAICTIDDNRTTDVMPAHKDEPP